MNKRIIIVIIFFLFLLTGCIKPIYHITFDTDDEILVVTEGDSFSLPTPEREGYEFKGWYLDNNYQQLFTENSKIDKDIKLYAKWVIKQYTISLDTGEEITLNYQEEIELNEPTRNDFTFGGWFLDNKYTQAFTLDKMPAYNLTLYAKWEEIEKVTVVFETNGGSKINTQTVTKGTKLTNVIDPIKEGFFFRGWYLDVTFKNPFDFNSVIENDLTLYAKWEEIEKFTIEFETNGGSEINNQTVYKGSKLTNLDNPIKVGYKFKGWYLDNSFQNAFDINTIIENDLTLYAKWERINYSINYHLNGGSFEYESKDQLIIDLLNDFYHYVDPTEDMNTFIHGSDNYSGTWTNYLDKLYTVGEKNPNSKPYFINQPRYHQKWIIFFDFIDGLIKEVNPNQSFWNSTYEGRLRLGQYIRGKTPFTTEQLNRYPAIQVKNIYHIEEEVALPIPYLMGYEFVGWYLNPEFTGSSIDKISIGTHGEVHIYAKWEAVVISEYLIEFDVNGGNTLQPMTVITNQVIESLPTPTKTNASFYKWTLDGEELLTPFTYTFNHNITIKANWVIPYSSNGTPVSFRNGTRIYVPEQYEEKNKDFRGMWVSNLTGDVASFSNKTQMMNQLTRVLDNLEEWNMNAIIYHIRINNDALYDTMLSPKSKYVMNADFAEWDYLEWFIDEVHKRGIEFHAWMNPYRITSSGATTKEAVMQKVADYPLNPANDPDNILLVNNGAILNPGEPAVRKFLIDSCIEVIEKYDVDAIHFDDYFYASMPSNADSATYNKYKANSNTTNIDDWRREQIDIFIRDLSIAIDEFNNDNGRDVELGISPSGVWKSGNGIVSYDQNGTAITNGSHTTTSFNHYNAYLYSDTKKWIDEEWIDYICPQVYWGFTHPSAAYADIVDWWAKVVKYKDVKLYIGIGIYMESESNTYSWKTNPYEFSDQILFNSKYQDVDGAIIFRYNYMKSMINKGNLGTLRVLNDYWTKKVSTPK